MITREEIDQHLGRLAHSSDSTSMLSCEALRQLLDVADAVNESLLIDAEWDASLDEEKTFGLMDRRLTARRKMSALAESLRRKDGNG